MPQGAMIGERLHKAFSKQKYGAGLGRLDTSPRSNASIPLSKRSNQKMEASPYVADLSKKNLETISAAAP